MTNHQLEALLRAAGDRLPVSDDPPSRLAGRLPPRLPVADLDHLHLAVRDLAESAAFYQRWFGLTGDVVEGTLFARNQFGFLLCLTPYSEVEPLNAHFGFTLPHATAVRRLHDEMARAGLEVTDVYEEPGFASFRVSDPDGTSVEVFAE